MSIAYGLLNPAFDKPIVFYFEKFKKNDKKYNKWKNINIQIKRRDQFQNIRMVILLGI